MARPDPQNGAALRRGARRSVALSAALGVGIIVGLGSLWLWAARDSASRGAVLWPAREEPLDVGSGDGRAALVELTSAQQGRASVLERSVEPFGGAVEGAAQPEPASVLRMRVAGTTASVAQDLVLDLGLNEIEGFPVHWHRTLPLVRASGEHVAAIPAVYERRVLALEVRSRASDLSSGVVYLGRRQADDEVLDVTLREVGELVVVVSAPSGASQQTAAPGARPHAGGGSRGVATPASRLELQRLDVVTGATGGEVTTYGERVCAVDRGPRPNDVSMDGGRLFERVLAGGVRVEVEELRSRPATVDGRLSRGQRLVLTVPLVPLDFAGALSGTIVVEGLRVKGGVNVVARSLDDPQRTFVTVAVWTGDTSLGHCHTWRIEDVPSGIYEVIPMPSSFVRVDPPTHTAEAPAEGLDFVVHNDTELRWCDWNVIDATSRAPLENVWVDLERRDGTLRSLRLDLTPAERFPRSGDARWTVRCAGYEPISGTLADCDRVEPRALRKDELELADPRMQEVWVCDLELDPTNR